MAARMQRESRYSASLHFVWRQELSDILGEGGFGTVYRGVHKETGEPVAVKTFNRINGHRNASQIRELDILRRLDHPNIVRLIAIEEILRPRQNAYIVNPDSMEGKVLIMELCTEESLFANLDRPENQFGLEESEFLLVLNHMTSGMRYLHENKIIHRDWKPSNILKTIVDGKVTFKLGDFGAARICDENGHFTSICGTEEYLQPQIYRRALLGGSNGVFPVTSDLWSIGVTFYQTATALLPFRPFGGRKNREVMDKMTFEKESGVISGFQDRENGPINWRRELPAHCHLSSGLKPHVTKLLAGLLESKPHSVWNYEHYFHEVNKILSKMAIKFYVLGELSSRTVYLDKTADYFTFRNEISAQINSPVTDYAVLTGSILVDEDNWDECGNSRGQQSFILAPLTPQTSQADALGIPVAPRFVESDVPALDWDVDSAKTSLSVAYWIYAQQKSRRAICQDVLNAATQNKARLGQLFNFINQQWAPWKFTWSVLQKQFELLEKSYPAAEQKILAPKHSSIVQITQAMTSQEKEMLNLRSCCMEFSKLLTPEINSDLDKRDVVAMEDVIKKMDAIYTQFRKDKALRMDHNPESYHNELKWHSLQREQLKGHWEFCRNLNDENVERFKDFMRIATTYLTFAAKLSKNLATVELGVRNMEEVIRAFGASLEKLPKPSHHSTASSQDSAVSSTVKSHNSAISTVEIMDPLKITHSCLAIVKSTQEMRNVAQENRQMLDRFSIGN